MVYVLDVFKLHGEKAATLGHVIRKKNGKDDVIVAGVVGKGMPKVFVGDEGIYILDDETVTKLIKEVASKRIPLVKIPDEDEGIESIVVLESDIKNFLIEHGYPLLFKSCGYLIKGKELGESSTKEFIEHLNNIFNR